ncbi:hypothetical protein P7K49_037736 [Saguinus oedipus]|uniref:Uncharacterized protein n=1 Tax=Saguinus oedipus TaxID=9490 RepID=A0ABQ9TJ00_SAGOE|nr:hypothetical protein P7K49_037736 [Saguinus oedipus]
MHDCGSGKILNCERAVYAMFLSLELVFYSVLPSLARPKQDIDTVIIHERGILDRHFTARCVVLIITEGKSVLEFRCERSVQEVLFLSGGGLLWNKAPGLILFLCKILQRESWMVTLGKLFPGAIFPPYLPPPPPPTPSPSVSCNDPANTKWHLSALSSKLSGDIAIMALK